MNVRTKCLFYLVATATLWSISGVLIKSIDWNPLAIASGRSFIAAITISILARKTMVWSRPGRAQVVGAVFFTLVSVGFCIATKLTTAANAVLLQYTAPVWVAILAPLVLRERTCGRDWVFIVIAFSGMVMFFMDSLSAEGFWGLVIAMINGVFFAGLAISLRYVKGVPPFQSIIYGNLLTAALGLFFWRPPWPDMTGFFFLLIIGVFQLGISFYLFALATEGASSLEMVLITALEPILNPIWVFIFIGERPGHWSLVGGVVVLTTVTAWSVLKTLRPSPALDHSPDRSQIGPRPANPDPIMAKKE